MPGRNHPMPQHQRDTLAGAIPADPPIAEVEQEQIAPMAVVVEHNGPLTVHQLPARRAANTTVLAPIAPGISVLGVELKRSRVLLISTDQPFYYATAASKIATASTAAAAATLWPANVPLELLNADKVFLASAHASTAATIGVVIESWAD
jgi:hypothetical protein